MLPTITMGSVHVVYTNKTQVQERKLLLLQVCVLHHAHTILLAAGSYPKSGVQGIDRLDVGSIHHTYTVQLIDVVLITSLR